MTDAWRPDQYHRFQQERAQPFHDLLSLVEPVPGGRVVDLGCGTGELTALVAERLEAGDTVGVDRSAAMLDRAVGLERPGLRFTEGDLATWASDEPVDVIFANASLHWVPDHRRVLARWAAALAPDGQLAVQVPTNADHASHRLSAEVATEPPFLDAFDGRPPPDPVLEVLRPEQYAELLHELGFAEQHVRLQVYGHVLDTTESVVEWVKGTSLTRFQRVLSPELFEQFLARYTERLVGELGHRAPYFYAFKRTLFRARRGPGGAEGSGR